MTTPSEAAAVIAHIALVHRRTAPRPANNEEAIALAKSWARVFSQHNLELPDLLAAVEKRAADEGQAPEPAEIVKFARAIRSDRSDRMTPGERRALEDRRDAELAEKLSAIEMSGPKSLGSGAVKVPRGLSTAFGTSSPWARGSGVSGSMSQQ